MIRVDMSEYMEKHAVARMVGSPPGYVGHDEGGQLTEQVRRRPYSVLLFDEIEKAHPDVFHMLLQILDDGRLTDGQGRTVSFKNTVIVMTSNLGSQLISQKVDSDFSPGSRWDDVFAELRKELFQLLKATIRPEFLNRVDEIIIFRPLAQVDIRRIITLQLNRVLATLAAREITLEVTDEAKDWLAKLGYDPTYGARPLKRVIQKHVVNPLSGKILEGEFGAGDTVEVGLDARGLIAFSKRGVPRA
jgi:ATP-dependent Clp protease ATP-binding subunit ClpB